MLTISPDWTSTAIIHHLSLVKNETLFEVTNETISYIADPVSLGSRP